MWRCSALEPPERKEKQSTLVFPASVMFLQRQVLTSSSGEHSPSTAFMPPEVLLANEISGNRERGEHGCDHSYLMLAHTRGQA